MKKVAILGSTGSVGTSALEVIRQHPDRFKVVGLTAHRNAPLLARQANRFKPRVVALGDGAGYGALKRALREPRKVLTGTDGISEIASMKEADIVLVATSGSSALIPLISAIRSGKKIALANKEAIVAAGNIIMTLARSHRAEIIPVDSEHNSIFQCIKEERKKNIRKIFLMATGGPLKDDSKKLFDKLKPSRILSHPVWKMGKKISVDSATMMNKGLEVIEASHLFGMEAEKIEVLLHPEGVIHSMVEFVDGNVMSNLFYPDMRLPIFYALNHPERRLSGLPRLDFSRIRGISFRRPNARKFPALRLAYEAAKKGGTFPACLSAANEEAVWLYLKGKIKFTRIVGIVKKVLSRHKSIEKPSIDEIIYVNRWAKDMARRFAGKLGNYRSLTSIT